MTEKSENKEEIRKLKKKEANKKYYKKNQEIKKEQDNIQCPPKEIITDIAEDWIYNTMIGTLQMVGSTLFQVTVTLSIPVIIAMCMGKRSPTILTPPLKQEEKPIIQPITSLSLL